MGGRLSAEPTAEHRVNELLEANTKLVLENRELKTTVAHQRHRIGSLDDTIVELAKDLARARREIAVMQRVAEGRPFRMLGIDRDNTGGFDVVCDQRPRQDCGCAYLEHPPGEHREHKAGFDVGHGQFAEGDWCDVSGRIGKILSVLQDGEAEIEYLNLRREIVKWGRVRPATTVKP